MVKYFMGVLFMGSCWAASNFSVMVYPQITCENQLSAHSGPSCGYSYTGAYVGEPLELKGWLSWGDETINCSWSVVGAPFVGAGDVRNLFVPGQAPHHGFRNASFVAHVGGNYTLRLMAKSPEKTYFQDLSVMAWDRNWTKMPFVWPWNDSAPGPSSAWWVAADGPAGRRGVVYSNHSDGGKLYAGGERVRFWGTNMCFGGNFPLEEDADAVAGRISKAGFNIIRLMSMDSTGGEAASTISIVPMTPQGLDPSALNETMIRRLDAFVAALKRHGVHVHVTLHVNRAWPGLGGEDEFTKYDKGLLQLWDLAEVQWKASSKALLTHINPFTNLSLAQDPAAIGVEITNEDSCVVMFVDGQIDQAASKNASLQASIAQKWDDWCDSNHIPRQPVVHWQNFSSVSNSTKLNWLQFLSEMDAAFFDRAAQFLREEINFQGVIVGTQAHNSPLPALVNASVDVIDVHGYWADAGKLQGGKVSVNAVPQGGRWDGGMLGVLMGYRAWNKAFFVTEFNAPNPSPFHAEAAPLQAAILRSQDVDAAFLFTWVAVHYISNFGNEVDIYPHHGFDVSMVMEPFRSSSSPVRAVHMPAASAAFLRSGGAQDLTSTTSASISWHNYTVALLDRVLAESSWKGAMLGAADLGLYPPIAALTQKVGLHTTTTTSKPLHLSSPYPRCLSWQSGCSSSPLPIGQGHTILNGTATKFTTGLISTNDTIILADNVTFQILSNSSSGYAVASLTVTNGSDFTAPFQPNPRTMLFAVSGIWSNTNMTYNGPQRTVVLSPNMDTWGTAPTLAEPIVSLWTLPCPATSYTYTIIPLSDLGQPIPNTTISYSCKPSQSTISFTLDGQNQHTLWWTVEANE